MKKLLFVLITPVFILNACVPVNMQTSAVYPPTDPEFIEVFETPSLNAMKTLGTFAQSLPQKRYSKIADIPLRGTVSIDTVKKKAAKLGADAVIIINDSLTGLKAAAIKYYAE
ncbi:MAG: hypothetical protein LBR69_02655 [Endomicrobium sp.]|jgi:hypothetical protein|nr:hypothetical protein [Endomicrobium sp.]